MSAASSPQPISAVDYLARERADPSKNEFVDGVIRAMSGGTRSHSRICMNLSVLVGTQLKGRPCEAFGSDMKVRTSDSGLYSYPDLTISCHDPKFEDDEKDVLLNPIVVFEVFSPSTELFDRGRKFEMYRTIESLNDYVLVAQDRTVVEHFQRLPDGTWNLSVISNPDESLVIENVGVTLPLSEIYDRVEFD